MFSVLLEMLLICLCCLSSVSWRFTGDPPSLLYLLLHSCISFRLEANLIFWSNAFSLLYVLFLQFIYGAFSNEVQEHSACSLNHLALHFHTCQGCDVSRQQDETFPVTAEY